MMNQVCWHDRKGCSYPRCKFRHPSRDERGGRERAEETQYQKRKISDCEGESSQSQSQSQSQSLGQGQSKRQRNASSSLIESGLYRVLEIPSSLSLHSGRLEVSEGEIVSFSHYCHQHHRCHFVLVKNNLNEVGYIEQARMGESIAFHCSLFLDCEESFQKEDDFETHLCEKHFYETLKEAVLQHSVKSRRFRCPQRDCDEKFEEISDAILHFGARQHRAVVSLVYRQAGLALTTNLRLLQQKEKETEVRKELSELGKSMLEIDKLKAENQVKESENLGKGPFHSLRQKSGQGGKG